MGRPSVVHDRLSERFHDDLGLGCPYVGFLQEASRQIRVGIDGLHQGYT